MVGRTLYYAFELQLWVLLVVPLGVLAASEAARAGRRGWLTLLIALLILAPFAAWTNALTNNIQLLLAGPCLPNGDCPSGPSGAPWVVLQVAWAVAFLPIPLAALIASLIPARKATAPAAAEARQGERRTLIVCAIVGIVVMSTLGYLGTSGHLIPLFAHSSLAPLTQVEMALTLQDALLTVWFALTSLPVAIASLALTHAAQTGRREWLAGWIALVALALLTADLGSLGGWSLIAAALGAHTGDQIPFFQQLPAVSIATPVVIMLVALIYGLTVMRSRSRAATLTAA